MKTNTVVGLDLGASYIRGVQVTKDGKGNFTIDKVAEEPLPHAAIHEGEVIDQDEVVSALKRLWAKAKFTTRVVRIGVGDARTRAATGAEDYEPDEDFKKILPYQPISESLHESPEEHYMDWHTLSEYSVMESDPNDPDEKVRTKKKFILLGSGLRKIIDSRVRAVLSAKLKPVSVDLNSLALIRAYDSTVFDSEYKDVDISINMGAETLTVVLHKLGQPLFIRVQKAHTGSSVTTRIAEALGISEVLAERRKMEHLKMGEPPTMPTPTFEDSTRIPLSEETQENVQRAIHRYNTIDPIIKATVQEAISSISDTLYHFQGIDAGDELYSLSGIQLSGLHSLTPTLRDRLSAEFEVPVEFAQPLLSNMDEKKIARLPEEIQENDLGFAVAYGLAVGEGSTHA